MGIEDIEAAIGALDNYRSDIAGNRLQNEREWGRGCGGVYFQLKRSSTVAEPAGGQRNRSYGYAVECEPSIVSCAKEAVAFTFPGEHQLCTRDRRLAIIRDNPAKSHGSYRCGRLNLRERNVVR